MTPVPFLTPFPVADSCTGLVSPPETSEPPSTTSTRPPDTTTTEPDQCSASSSPCAPGTYCETGQEAPFCRCSDQLYAIADYRVNQIQCRRVDGASCLLDFKDPEYHSCVTNAFCYAENTTHGRCRCGAGFLRAEDGSCAGDLAQECGAPFQECYEPFMLECRNRKCECASPSLVYEAGLGCLAQVGEPCHIYNKIERQYRIQCASGLECAQTSVGRHVCQEASGASSVISFKLMLFLSVFAAMLSFSARSQWTLYIFLCWIHFPQNKRVQINRAIWNCWQWILPLTARALNAQHTFICPYHNLTITLEEILSIFTEFCDTRILANSSVTTNQNAQSADQFISGASISNANELMRASMD